MFISENIAHCLLNATVINLMGLTVERYLKVVYPFWSKKNLKRWMTHGAVVFSWVAGILSIGPGNFCNVSRLRRCLRDPAVLGKSPG